MASGRGRAVNPRPQLDGARILVVVYGHIADTIAAIPALRSLRADAPSARIEVLALDSVRPVLEPCPYIDAFVGWSDFSHKGARGSRLEKAATLAALGLKLRRNRYDATLVLHRSSGAMRRLAALVGSPVRAGASNGDDGFTHPAPPGPPVESSREENRRVLQGLGLDDDGGQIEIWTRPEDAVSAADLLGKAPGPVIGIHPGSDWSCQEWLPDRFGEVARGLQRELGATIVITGSKSEVGLQTEVAAALKGDPILIAGRTSFGQLVEIVRRLDLLVCVNSAPAAIARALGTPCLVVVGLEDTRYTGLESSDLLRVIQPRVPKTAGGWCEFGRWGVLSSCHSPMCRGLGGLLELGPSPVLREALLFLGQLPARAAVSGPELRPPAPR